MQGRGSSFLHAKIIRQPQMTGRSITTCSFSFSSSISFFWVGDGEAGSLCSSSWLGTQEILLSSAGIIDVCHMSCAIKGSTLWLLFVEHKHCDTMTDQSDH